MQLITRQGAGYRTRLMSEERARRFAACLSANAAFREVTIEESRQAKNWYRRHFVRYQPASEERETALLQGHQDRRRERAETEGLAYVFVLDPDSIQPFCWCQSTSGEVYEVTLFDCSCPDFRERLRGTGVRCKHMLALSAATERGEVLGMPAPRPARAASAANVSRDFPE